MITETGYTIQQVAELTGLSEHTLRYYERIGLVTPADRAANGHRRYSEAAIREIEFLNRLRTTGMSIREMQHYAELWRQGETSMTGRYAMLKKHHATVVEQLHLLEENLHVIENKIALYQKLLEEQQHYEQQSEQC